MWIATILFASARIVTCAIYQPRLMNNQAIFVFKILLFSLGLSLLVKYGGRYLELQPTTITALTIVLMPSVVIGLILGWRYYQV